LIYRTHKVNRKKKEGKEGKEEKYPTVVRMPAKKMKT
jgi:hypothetical protein